MRVYLGCDHAGFELKNYLLEHLRGGGHDVTDLGPQEYDAEDDYPPFCIAAAEAVRDDEGSLGVVIGGSGNGEQMAANKVAGIRAALVYNRETAALAREHNNAQVAGIGARMHSLEEAAEIIDTFLATAWSGAERHQRRIDLLTDYEAKHA
ncbi:ribose 5-phosphate isomerase B [Antricoccus suffuscus]|uniref:Ribose-5-phosphate isomerase B n=1 Tax=Antricoccus suffuscus TaxID=1629062 RepID=A0A2T0ZVV1_9ACTN|nr:ribose-5-phosphate isomerase [Antricoccus suffuscus]PRZ40424.1 ribose 5-phosphate isomerase B [Antricoccus suffuscus]